MGGRKLLVYIPIVVTAIFDFMTEEGKVKLVILKVDARAKEGNGGEGGEKMQIITRSSAASRPSSSSGRSQNPTPLSDRDVSVIDMADFRNLLLLYAITFTCAKTLKATKARMSTTPLL